MCQFLPPATLIDNLLRNASLSQRIALLLRAMDANKKRLRLLGEMRLTCVEQGWEDYWKLHHERTQETLAEIERVLATC